MPPDEQGFQGQHVARPSSPSLCLKLSSSPWNESATTTLKGMLLPTAISTNSEAIFSFVRNSGSFLPSSKWCARWRPNTLPAEHRFALWKGAPSQYNLFDAILTNERARHMTSNRKAEANRRNARKSTGPRTSEGKAAVRQNALKHGLLSQEVLLPDEDENAMRDLVERMRAELQPVGELENLLVDRIIAAYWRLRRLGTVEAGIFAWERSGALAEQAEQEARIYEGQFDPEELIALAHVANNTIIDKEKHKEALARARQYRNEQKAEIATLGRTFARDADKVNAFSKLSRYETTIERGLYKALHELERRQAARRGGNVPAPVAVDVDVSGIPEGNR